MRQSSRYSAYERWVDQTTRSLTSLLTTRHSLLILGLISFAESALPVPIITDPFMVAYIMAQRMKVIPGIIMTTVASILGGLAAFFVAHFFSDRLLAFSSPSTVAQFDLLVSQYADSSFLLAFLGAITPVPFTLAAVVAGAMHGSVLLFILGAFVGRIIRYGITGYLTYRFGDAALAMAKRNILPTTILAFLFAALYLYVTL